MLQWISVYCHLLVSQQYKGRYSSHLWTSLISRLHLHTQNTISNRNVCVLSRWNTDVRLELKDALKQEKTRNSELKQRADQTSSALKEERMTWQRQCAEPKLAFAQSDWNSGGKAEVCCCLPANSVQLLSFSLYTTTILISGSTSRKLHWMSPERLHTTCSRNTLICGGGTAILILTVVNCTKVTLLSRSNMRDSSKHKVLQSSVHQLPLEPLNLILNST